MEIPSNKRFRVQHYLAPRTRNFKSSRVSEWTARAIIIHKSGRRQQSGFELLRAQQPAQNALQRMLRPSPPDPPRWSGHFRRGGGGEEQERDVDSRKSAWLLLAERRQGTASKAHTRTFHEVEFHCRSPRPVHRNLNKNTAMQCYAMRPWVPGRRAQYPACSVHIPHHSKLKLSARAGQRVIGKGPWWIILTA